jgi:hypothetical protein
MTAEDMQAAWGEVVYAIAPDGEDVGCGPHAIYTDYEGTPVVFHSEEDAGRACRDIAQCDDRCRGRAAFTICKTTIGDIMEGLWRAGRRTWVKAVKYGPKANAVCCIKVDNIRIVKG